MLIISTVPEAIGLMLVGILLLGTWPAVWHQVEQSGRLPSHTFLDYCFTYLVFAAACALTLGQLGPAAVSPMGQSLQFFDQLRQQNWQLVLFALAGGTCLALGDLALQYSLALCGLSIGPPILNSITLIVGVVLSYFLDGGINKPQLVFTGAAFAALAVGVGAAAHVVAQKQHSLHKHEEQQHHHQHHHHHHQHHYHHPLPPKQNCASGCSSDCCEETRMCCTQQGHGSSSSSIHIWGAKDASVVCGASSDTCPVDVDAVMQCGDDACSIKNCEPGYQKGEAPVQQLATQPHTCHQQRCLRQQHYSRHPTQHNHGNQQQHEQQDKVQQQQQQHVSHFELQGDKQNRDTQQHVPGTASPRRRSISSSNRPSLYLGLVITVIGGVIYGCFMPAFQIAANDPFKVLATPTPALSVYTTYFYFAIGFTAVSAVVNAWLMYRPPLGIRPSTFAAYLLDNKGRPLSILSGLLAAAGDLTQFIGGQTAGYAAAMMVMAYPVVGVLWGLLRFKELRQRPQGLAQRVIPWGLVLVIVQVVLYMLSVGLLSGSAELRSHA